MRNANEFCSKNLKGKTIGEILGVDGGYY